MQEAIALLKGEDVLAALRGREAAILEAVRGAYLAHARGESAVPHSSFLRFPAHDRERIIALPAFLGGGFEVVGIKWIASFPRNVARGVERASAVLILNSMETGHPRAILEGSIVSAKRTAASAALAARHLWVGAPPRVVGLVGCGPINFEILRFLLAVHPTIERLLLYDLSVERARAFARRGQQLNERVGFQVVSSLDALWQHAPLLSFATSAVTPYVAERPVDSRTRLVLHVSLRDLSPTILLAAGTDNVVDDVGHVCRAQTSIHLAEQRVGHRRFIRCTLGDLLSGASPPPREAVLTIFSPFGLGILDLAVADLAVRLARQEGAGLAVDRFFPPPWTARID